MADEVTSRILDGRVPVQIDYGRDQSRNLSPIKAGTATFALDNTDRELSPENTASTLYGKVIPGRPVQITAAPTLTYATDTFTRTVAAGGWGSADLGGAWTPSFSGSDFSVSSGVGRFSLGVVNSERAIWLPVATTDLDMAATFVVPVTAAGAPINAYLIARRIDDNNRFRARLRFDTNGDLGVQIQKTVAGVASDVTSVASAGTYTAGNGYRMRFRVAGTNLRAKAWPVGSTEPDWQIAVTDTSLTTSTSIAVRALLSSGNTNTLPVVVTMDDLSVTEPYDQVVLYNGFLDDFDLLPDLDERYVSVDCIDGLGQLSGQEVTTGLYRGIRTGEAIGYLLDAIGWSATLRDLDAGATVMPYWWLDGTDAYTALMDLVASEGPPALATVDSAGRLMFRDRHHRLVRAPSTTVQATWYSSGDLEPGISPPADYNHGWKEIINSATFDVPIRATTTELSVAWQAPGRLSIPDSDTLTVTASGSTAFMDAVTPVDGVDYTTAQGSVSVTLTRTSGQAILILLTAVGGPAVIDDLQLRARTVDTVTTVKVTVEDSASVGTYGRRSAPSSVSPTWANAYDAQAIGELLVGRRAERLPTISVTMVGTHAARRSEMLTRDLGDRVHLIETHTGLDADCFIEQIAHTITQGGLEHRTTFGLEKLPAEVSNPFTFGVSGQGFDQGLFQALGAVSGITMFRFDISGQGFGQGLFAY